MRVGLALAGVALSGLALAAAPACGGAEPESAAARAGPQAPASGGSIRYLANEGVLVSLPEGTVLIDGLFGDGLPEYPVVEGATRDSLERGLGAYGEIDLLLVTHVHRDHFDARAVERHLLHNPEARLLAPRQVADSLRVLGTAFDEIRERVVPVDLEAGEFSEIEVAGIFVRALAIAHPPSRNQPVEHIVYVVGGERRVIHMGDMALDSDGVEVLETGKGAAVALAPYWILDGEESVARIERTLEAGCLVGFHVGREERESAGALLAERAPGARLFAAPTTLSLDECI